MSTQTEQIHNIDAKGKSMGRVATEAARLLMGKDSPQFVRNRTTMSRVSITNADKIYIEERKKKQKHYVRYSGYPGGKKEESLERVLLRKGISEILRRAVYGMLPANKLRKPRMKQLEIHI